MFNFQGSEIIIILLLALVVLGPEKLPEAMRRLGRLYADLKKMSTGFQEEFRAAVDEPTRELRDTANTLRDSLDFRKLQDGDRAEKPKSAEMATADAAPAGPVPTDLAPADPESVPSDDVPFRHSSTPPAPPPPFSSSQSISAVPKERPESDPAIAADAAGPSLARQVAVDDEHGLREARPADSDDGS